MEIELFNGDAKAIVDPEGAWLTNLSDQNGDILYPRRTLTASDGGKKVRGGCHVCLPNFGPGGKSGLGQHGFGRTMLWRVQRQADTRVTLALPRGEGVYGTLAAAMTYELMEARLVITLEVENKGDDALRMAPAFHPYFALPRGTKKVVINDEGRLLQEFDEAEFKKDVSPQTLTSSRTIRIQSSQLPVWAYWTDMLGPYMCIEPTQAGFSFLNEVPDKEELLAPHTSKTVAVTIEW